MKKLLVRAAAALLSAAPAETAPVTTAPAAETAAPSLFVSQEEIRQRVAAAEAEREGAQMSTSFWYMVAAIALGIIIASLLLS